MNQSYPTLNLERCVAHGNKGGVVKSDYPINVNAIDCEFTDNGNTLFDIKNPQALLAGIGVRREVMAGDLVSLLRALHGKGELDRRELARKSTFMQKYAPWISSANVFLTWASKLTESNIEQLLNWLSGR